MSLHSQIDRHKIYESYLYKKGVYNTSWRRRYFVLYDDRTVDYFKNKSYSTQRNKAKGSIHLTQIKRVKLVQYKNDNNNTNILSYINTSPILSISNKDSNITPLQSESSDNGLYRHSSYNTKLRLKRDVPQQQYVKSHKSEIRRLNNKNKFYYHNKVGKLNKNYRTNNRFQYNRW